MSTLYLGTITHDHLKGGNVPKGTQKVLNYIVSATDHADATKQFKDLETQFQGLNFKFFGCAILTALPDQPIFVGATMISAGPQVSPRNGIEVSRAIVEQRDGTFSRISIRASFEGYKEHRVCGMRTSVVDLSLPSVTLLTRSSTPQNQQVADDAEYIFEKAIHELLKTGRSFYTTLHPGWNMPDYIWQRV